MMKKLVVLMLVVGMASLASAGFTMSSVTVNAGETAVLNLGADLIDAVNPLGENQRNFTVMLGQPDVDAGLSLGGTATAGAAGVFTPGSALAVFVIPNPMNGWAENGVMDRGENVTSSDGTTTLFGVGSIFTFEVDVAAGTAAGTYDVGALAQGAGIATILGTITVVPEPMTMALLGLGGLFLRRKK